MIWQLALGLVLMLVGGDVLVRGAVAVAERLGVSPLVIGVTLIAFGTSAPELAACIEAALSGAPGIAVGNVVGSNIANVLLILAAGALLMPIPSEPRVLWRDGSVLLASTAVCTVIVLTGHVGRGLGAVMVLALMVYLLMAALDDRRQAATDGNGDGDRAKGRDRPLPRNLALVALGLGGVLLGAHLVVEGAIDLALWLGVSDAVIGLTVVAFGTSLPELATAMAASLKRQGALAFGNVVGSNIINVLGIFGLTALVQPIDVPADVAAFDIWVMVAATMLLLIFAFTHRRVSRREGGALLAGYIAYIGLHAWAIGA